MPAGELTRLSAETLYLVLWLSAPALLVSLAIGLIVGLLQAVTQVQDQTLAFVPRLAAVGITLAVAGAWMGAELLRFTRGLWLAAAEIGL
ncbi:MAG TPA: type III secretion system export apparatus subunit SctS [Polyangiaceae bacterium LLY-WYZ-14_1]|jgi:flagellar biosynthetic protein FliQ|nr:type III secretion system export apparatus subunit SctS [Polyangiaceae bacterium LLY-WYZ-14_1]